MKFRQIAALVLAGTLLAACNSTDATLGVEGAGQSAATPAVVPTPTVAAATPGDVAASAVRIRFAPIIGAPVDKVTPLSRRLSARAKEKSYAIVASTDTTATHVFKGYFSILAEEQSSTIIYVFDVLDPSGNRLHRIQGQESVPGNDAANAWSIVPPNVMETIADKTVSGFSQWLGAPNS